MRTRLASVAVMLALFGAGVVAPSAADEEDDDLTLLDLSLGFPYEEDFQDDDGGWDTTQIPPPPPREPTSPSWSWDVIPTEPVRVGPSATWEWGAPTHGPDSASVGQNVWATGLHADYERYACAGLMSPEIDLTSASSASVAFDHWHELHATTTLAHGSGLLFVTTDDGETLQIVDPDNGYDRNMAIGARNCLDSQPTGVPAYTADSDGWITDNVDLSAFTGQSVRFIFGFSGSTVTTQGAGWYLDNYRLTVDGSTTTQDFEASDGGFIPVAVQTPAGSLPPGGAHSGDNAWATMPSGAFSAIECSGIMSPALDLSGADSASVAFHHWHEMRELSTSAPHLAVVFATTDGGDTLVVIEPDGGYDSNAGNTAAQRCLDEYEGAGISGGPAADWEEVSFDLEDFLGEPSLQIVLGFTKDAVGDWSGWYVDTWTTTIDGVTTVEDFGSSDGGFTVVGVQPPPHPRGWEWGEPSTGPDVANNTNLWATQLHGNYGHFECSWIESPSFQVGPLPDPTDMLLEASLAWQQWFRSNSIYASGVVQVGHNGNYTILEPEGGYPGSIGSTSATFAEVTQWQTDCFGLDWQPGDPLESGFAGLHDGLGEPLGEQRADLTPWVGEEITLRFIFSSGWRDANPALHPGWYIDDIEVELRATLSIPDPLGELPDLDNLDAPGWSNGGDPEQNEWEWGQEDLEFYYATNFDGPYTNPHCGYIESPAFSGSSLSGDSSLVIDHRYGTAQSGSFAWHAGVVVASADDGPWTPVVFDDHEFSASTAARNCVGSLTGDTPPTGTSAFGGWELDWHASSADLAAFEDADEIRLRFVMGGSLTTGCNEETTPCIGWDIRSVQVGGQELLALPDSLLPLLGLPLSDPVGQPGLPEVPGLPGLR